MTPLAPSLQAWFTDRLITQRNCSPQTIAAYRDTFRLLLCFAREQTGKQPFELDLSDLDASLIGAFLNHLEHDRANSPRTRNARLGAIHSFYRFAALEHPEHAATIARVMAIPTKGHERTTVSYLDLPEIKALLAAPDRSTWLGRRDGELSNVVDPAMKNDQAATLSSVIPSSWLSSSMTWIPSLNFTPSSTSATSSWPLNRRQRSWADSSSL